MQPTQAIAFDWAIRSFGADHVFNTPLRALRLAEEAVELAQACKVPEEKMQELVKIVYSRPTGMVHQEVGGVMMTLNVLCAALNIDPDEAFVKELRRVLSKSPEHFAKRNADKMRVGLTA